MVFTTGNFIMDTLLKSLADFGAMGAIVAILFWQNNRITDRITGKLIEIIEKNTKAFDELKSIIDKCQVIHDKKD